MPDTIVRLAAFLPTPGYCDEEMVFFRLSGLSTPPRPPRSGRRRGHRAPEFSIAEARDMVRRGEITDMKTVVGLAIALDL